MNQLSAIIEESDEDMSFDTHRSDTFGRSLTKLHSVTLESIASSDESDSLSAFQSSIMEEEESELSEQSSVVSDSISSQNECKTENLAIVMTQKLDAEDNL